MTPPLLPKFDRYVRPDARAVFLAQLEAVSGWVSIVGATQGCRDPNDDKLLETALQGQADCIVTGDADLLVMSPFQGIPILTPTEQLARSQDNFIAPELRGYATSARRPGPPSARRPDDACW